MITLSDRSLITPTEVADAALGGISVDDLNKRGAIFGICNEASQEIERKLLRDCRIHSETFEPVWMASDTDYAYEAWAWNWPVVEVTSDTTVVVGEARPGGQLIYSDEKHTEITAFVGFRRENETLVKLQALTGLSALTVLPPALPDIIRSAACMVALYKIQERTAGRFSGNRTVSNIGSNNVTVDYSDRNHLRKVLRSVEGYRRAS